MFWQNPFSVLAATFAPAIMQGFVLAMIALVAVGTFADMIHKRSATYFFRNWASARGKATRNVSAGTVAVIATKTIFVDWLASGEFCNVRRRIAHLLGMYGFLAYAIATVVLVFVYPTRTTPAPALWPFLWHAGALMVCIGGYWFWFFIRVDVAAEGHSPFRIVRADLFVLLLLASATLALAWSWLQSIANPWMPLAFVLYILATTLLFASVPWSKFSHMFYKPAAAFQKRLETADGSRSNLPAPADKPSILGGARRQPSHY